MVQFVFGKLVLMVDPQNTIYCIHVERVILYCMCMEHQPQGLQNSEGIDIILILSTCLKSLTILSSQVAYHAYLVRLPYLLQSLTILSRLLYLVAYYLVLKSLTILSRLPYSVAYTILIVLHEIAYHTQSLIPYLVLKSLTILSRLYHTQF